MRKDWGMLKMFVILIMVMGTAYQALHFKYMQVNVTEYNYYWAFLGVQLMAVNVWMNNKINSYIIH